ncbi:MAG TPA: OmpA family protein [Verrucomicrobiae bacterium]|nr:OmpA family protein [Verrucomicrobiae bacterium]
MKKPTARAALLILAAATLGGCANKELVKQQEPLQQAQPAAEQQAQQQKGTSEPAAKPRDIREEPIASEPVRPATEAAAKAQAGGGEERGTAAQVEAKFDTLYFAYDSFVLTQEARDQLARAADALKKNRSLRLQIAGYCDERGSDEYNLALGERRAKAALDYLLNLGVSPDRFSVISYGEENPADPGHDEAAWTRNRRVELTVIK